jgi:hypothetical protein
VARRAFHLASRRKLGFEPLESRHMLATLLVSNLNDAPVAAAGDAPGTLRQAIYDANHSIHTDDPDIIQFSAGLAGNINLSVADDLTFGPSALVITSSMHIEGNGHALTIKRDASVSNLRLFFVAPGASLTIDSLMLTGGVAQGATGAAGQNGGDGLGGAIYNQGTTTVVASTLYGNSAIAGPPARADHTASHSAEPYTATAAFFPFTTQHSPATLRQSPAGRSPIRAVARPMPEI